MKKTTYFLIICLLFSFSLSAQKHATIFETSGGKQTGEYHSIIDWWQKIDREYNQLKMIKMGLTDSGYPLHLVIISSDGDFDLTKSGDTNKSIILINNGIHAGEPDGIDASMLMARDILTGRIHLPKNIILAIIPVYNIGGLLNRSANYRVNQNGPVEKGFRGNAQNLDLNRDFIKNDSRNAGSFASIFHMCDPDVFIDNHVSNGADYQHVMTLLTTQHNKLGGKMGKYLNEKFEPAIYSMMEAKGYDLIPYVNFPGKTPESGLIQFFDSPRYSTGYAALWNSFSFMPETHMLKPYKERVRSTYALMESIITFTSQNINEIKAIREKSKKEQISQSEFELNWKPDTTQKTTVRFSGYESGIKKSDVSSLPVLFYNRNKPYVKDIPYYNVYKSVLTIKRPEAYIIPQGWWKVTQLLTLNKVRMIPLKNDTSIKVTAYRISDYTSSPRQYEGHHPNSDVTVIKDTMIHHFRKGDLYIPMNQIANRFIMQVLEPEADDSYFSWNFFDAILGAKEYFSDYAFEETAAAYLHNNPSLKKQLEARKSNDTAFAKNSRAQLDFVFRNSPYYEPDHNRYPVYKVIN